MTDYDAMSQADLVGLVRARDESLLALKLKTKDFVTKSRGEKDELQAKLDDYTSKLKRAKVRSNPTHSHPAFLPPLPPPRIWS